MAIDSKQHPDGSTHSQDPPAQFVDKVIRTLSRNGGVSIKAAMHTDSASPHRLWAKNRANPMNASRAVMIQKRMTTLVSLQPFCSK